MAQPSPSLVFPLGHYIGAYYPEDGAPLSYHTVRIGRQPIRLHSDDELAIWGLAHGGEQRDRPWTRQDVLDMAETAEIPDAEQLLDELIHDDIIVEVLPGTEDAIDFAEAHRVVPLQFGLGPGDTPGLHRIGFGDQAALEVDGFTFELWRLGRLADDLWGFCEAYGESLRTTSPDLPADETAAEQLLTRALPEIQTLLGRHAAYLDVSPAQWT